MSMNSKGHWTGVWATVGFCVAVLAVAWLYHRSEIAPLREQETEALRQVAELKDQILNARKSVGELHAIELDINEASGELHALKGDRPSTPTLVWFPERVKDHFDRLGIVGAVT